LRTRQVDAPGRGPAFGLEYGVVQHRGQPSGLRRRELVRAHAEVVAGRRLSAAQPARAPRRVVEVKPQHAGLAQRLIHLHGVQQLAQLACRRAFGAGDEQLGQLLVERARAALGTARVVVAGDRRGELGQVVARVVVKALVFGRDDGARDPAVRGQP
jgi:hypothetical protein